MDSKLYVGNLPYQTTEDDLRSLFEQAGAVTEVAIIMDRETGRSKGFAFVTMADQAGAEAAIRQFNGYSMNQRELKVNIARPKEDRGFGGGGGGYGGGGYGNRGGGGGYGNRGGGGGRGNDRDRRGGSGRY
jgi:RNA recognition motif-containing protein